MPLACIIIQRHKPGLYEWVVSYSCEQIDGDTGESSISGCLTSAAASLPEFERLVEIKYRGLPYGHILDGPDHYRC